MSQVTKAAEDILSFASRVRSFLEVADVLKGIGDIEQAVSEAKIKLDRANQEAAAAEAEATAKKSVVAKLDEEIEYARKSAEEIIANAKKRSVEIADEASIAGNNMLRTVTEKKAAFETELKGLRDKMGFVEAAIKEKESVLAGIEEKIAEAKERVASLFK